MTQKEPEETTAATMTRKVKRQTWLTQTLEFLLHFSFFRFLTENVFHPLEIILKSH